MGPQARAGRAVADGGVLRPRAHCFAACERAEPTPHTPGRRAPRSVPIKLEGSLCGASRMGEQFAVTSQGHSFVLTDRG